MSVCTGTYMCACTHENTQAYICIHITTAKRDELEYSPSLSYALPRGTCIRAATMGTGRKPGSTVRDKAQERVPEDAWIILLGVT